MQPGPRGPGSPARPPPRRAGTVGGAARPAAPHAQVASRPVPRVIATGRGGPGILSGRRRLPSLPAFASPLGELSVRGDINLHSVRDTLPVVGLSHPRRLCAHDVSPALGHSPAGPPAQARGVAGPRATRTGTAVKPREGERAERPRPRGRRVKVQSTQATAQPPTLSFLPVCKWGTKWWRGTFLKPQRTRRLTPWADTQGDRLFKPL